MSALLICIFKFSRYLGKTVEAGDYEPVKWFGFVVVFILSSIVLGKVVLTEKRVKAWFKRWW